MVSRIEILRYSWLSNMHMHRLMATCLRGEKEKENNARVPYVWERIWRSLASIKEDSDESNGIGEWMDIHIEKDPHRNMHYWNEGTIIEPN